MKRLWSGVLLLATVAVAQPRATWRAATAQELAAVVPARAQVINERIETEQSASSGITDGRGHTIAATVLITAGYAAHGRYSHFLIVQSAMRLEDKLTLQPGEYLVGWTRVEDGLRVVISDAATGAERGVVRARPSETPVTVVPIRISPPAQKSVVQIGRFVIPYSLP